MKSIIFQHIKIIVIIITTMLLYDIVGISCPIRNLFGVPCPSCGMTRSLVALINFDFSLSLFYNPMTILTILLFLFTIHKDLLCKPKYSKIIILLSSSSIFIVYIFRLINCKIP